MSGQLALSLVEERLVARRCVRALDFHPSTGASGLVSIGLDWKRLPLPAEEDFVK
jgi:hypothetical protein